MVLSRACRTEMPGKFSHEISNSALHFYQTVTKPWSPEPWAAAWAAPSPLGVSVGNPDAEGPPQVQSLERTQGWGSGVALSGGGGEGAGLHIWPFDEIARWRTSGCPQTAEQGSWGRLRKTLEERVGSCECLRVAEGDRAVGAGPLEVLFGGGAEGEGEGAWSYVCESTLRTWGL